VVASGSSTRALLVTGLSAASDTGGITSAMVESCRVEVLFVAGCCGTVPFGTNLPSSSISTPVSTDTLQRCFSAVVCVQVVIGPFAAVQKLPPGTAEAGAKSGTCGRPQFACGGVYVNNSYIRPRSARTVPNLVYLATPRREGLCRSRLALVDLHRPPGQGACNSMGKQSTGVSATVYTDA